MTISFESVENLERVITMCRQNLSKNGHFYPDDLLDSPLEPAKDTLFYVGFENSVPIGMSAISPEMNDSGLSSLHLVSFKGADSSQEVRTAVKNQDLGVELESDLLDSGLYFENGTLKSGLPESPRVFNSLLAYSIFVAPSRGCLIQTANSVSYGVQNALLMSKGFEIYSVLDQVLSFDDGSNVNCEYLCWLYDSFSQ